MDLTFGGTLKPNQYKYHDGLASLTEVQDWQGLYSCFLPTILINPNSSFTDNGPQAQRIKGSCPASYNQVMPQQTTIKKKRIQR